MSPAMAPVDANATERRVAMSAGQEGVWFAAGLDARAAAAYTMVFAFEADGQIDIALLERALDVLQDRHEVLRARVVVEDGAPRLAFHAAGSCARIRVARRTGSLQDVAHDEAARAIELDAAPLMRVIHVAPAVGDGPAGLLFRVPHLVFDGPSADRFFAELDGIAHDLAGGVAVHRETDDGAAQTYVRSESAWLQGMEGRAAIAALRARIAPVAPPRRARSNANANANANDTITITSTDTGLTTGPVNGSNTGNGSRDVGFEDAGPGAGSAPPQIGTARVLEFPIAADGLARIAAFARTRRASPAAVWLAAFEVALWRCRGAADFLVALPVSQHDRIAEPSALGYFTNLGVACARLDGTLAGADFVRRVNDDLLDMLDTRALPFKAVAAPRAGTGRSTSTPLPRWGFNYERIATGTSFRLAPCTLRACDTTPRWAKDELKLDVVETPRGARGWLVADSQAFDDAALGDFAGALFEILEAFLDTPSQPLGRLGASIAA